MFLKLPLRGFLFLGLLIATTTAIAQPTLPDIAVSKDKGINVISWDCQYDGIKSIAVQRSSDSVYNYKTIGYVASLKKGVQAFIDGHPNPGKNFYRLYIVFNSQLTWYSNRARMIVDSADIRNKRVLPPNDSLQKLVPTLVFRSEPAVTTTTKPATTNTATATKPATTPPGRSVTPSTAIEKLNGNTGIAPIHNDSLSLDLSLAPVNVPPPPPKITIEIPETPEDEGFSFVQSQYVYTDPFTGHVTIDLPDSKKHYYMLTFKNSEGKKVMVIEKINEDKVILDKHNFNKKGIYDFELKRDHKPFENGKISIF